MESAILETFAEAYPASAQRRGGRALRLRNWSARLPSAFASAAAQLTFLDTMERLQLDGIVKLIWKKRREGDELDSAELSAPRKLYEHLGLDFPDDLAEELRESARAASTAAADRGDPAAAALFRYVAGHADELYDRLAPHDIDDADRLFRHPAGETARLPLRALSIVLYNDSKRLERLASVLGQLYERTVRPDYPDHAGFPERSYPEAAVAGCVELVFKDGTAWNLGPGAVSLSMEAAANLVAIHLIHKTASLAGSLRALSVENKETFHAFARDPRGFDFIVCSGGRPNRAVRSVLRALAASGAAVHHAGDLDADGIAILAEAAGLCGAQPYGMDCATFDRYLPYARELDRSLVSRLDSIPAAALELDGIPALIGRIRATGKGVEQEIIDYGELNHKLL
jgi:hypothetical protein